MAICKLCLKEKDLIKKSHIIPEFMYQRLFDSNHKLRHFNPIEMSKGEGFVKKPSSGEYEGGLLCQKCESEIIGSYESYATKAMYGGQLPAEESPICENFFNQDNVKYSVCKNISYKKYKLFLLSILWRASISKRQMFNEISLGPHEEVIRKMVYEGNPGEVSDYPIAMYTFFRDNSITKDVIAHPQKRKVKSGHTTNVFIIAGTIYMFYVNSSQHTIPNLILNDTIKPNNQMTLYHIPDGNGMDLILSFYGLKRPNH